MNKETRKKLEQELITATESILRHRNGPATTKIKKVVKDSSRQVAKKFAKAIKLQSKKSTNKRVPSGTKSKLIVHRSKAVTRKSK